MLVYVIVSNTIVGVIEDILTTQIKVGKNTENTNINNIKYVSGRVVYGIGLQNRQLVIEFEGSNPS